MALAVDKATIWFLFPKMLLILMGKFPRASNFFPAIFVIYGIVDIRLCVICLTYTRTHMCLHQIHRFTSRTTTNTLLQ